MNVKKWEWSFLWHRAKNMNFLWYMKVHYDIWAISIHLSIISCWWFFFIQISLHMGNVSVYFIFTHVGELRKNFCLLNKLRNSFLFCVLNELLHVRVQFWLLLTPATVNNNNNHFFFVKSVYSTENLILYSFCILNGSIIRRTIENYYTEK